MKQEYNSAEAYDTLHKAGKVHYYGVNNKTTDMSYARDDSVLDYCRLHDITIQAWSPQHMAEIAAGTEFTMSREEWYEIYLGSGKFLP